MKRAKQIKRKGPTPRISRIFARRCGSANSPHLGRLHVGQTVIRAALGSNGVSCRKREGDGRSPAGSFWLLTGYFRPDRMRRPESALKLKPTPRSLGWCDDPASRMYNKPLPAGSCPRHERLWRDDRVYDIVIPTSHNRRPTIIGAGSAIFLHLARPDYSGTEGCIAIGAADMRRLLPRLKANVKLVIG